MGRAFLISRVRVKEVRLKNYKMLRHGIRTRPLFLCLPSHRIWPVASAGSPLPLHSNTRAHTLLPVATMEPPKSTVLFNTVGRTQYGFDVFSVSLLHPPYQATVEHRLTDGISINFNAQFVEDQNNIVFISERTGSPRIYMNQPGIPQPQPLASTSGSLFHDRPIIKNRRLYFVSAHEQPDQPFKSWSAVYSVGLDEKEIIRLTPKGNVDYSPSLSQTGKFIAVASYGSRPWGGDFRELHTEIVAFTESNPAKRAVLSERGGWPTWSGDSTIYFHRQSDDGWWSIFRVDLPDSELSGSPKSPIRVTPPGLHCFTPAAMHDGKRIAVATRRRGKNFRHIEVFDLESQTFNPITELINPNFHHYNPFVSPNSDYLGYHRFRGESTQGESTIPCFEPVASPINQLRMLRINGAFPAFSPGGDLVAFNQGLARDAGVKIVKSDGSKRWTLFEGRVAFYNSWSPTEKHVIYTSIGPIFESAKTTVQIARIRFDPKSLTDDREDIPCDIKILTSEDAGNNAFPSCSPDGEYIVFRSGRSGHKNLYIMDAIDGEFNGAIRRLTNGEWIDTMPSWSPKGDLIAFSSNMHNPKNPEAFSIYVIRPDGSGLRRIHFAGPEGSAEVDRERINHVCFSQDGEWLLFAANLSGVSADPVSWPNQFQPYGDLHAARLDGTGLTRLTCNGYENGTPACYPGDMLDLGRLLLEDGVGDKLEGDFEEPLWISCDI